MILHKLRRATVNADRTKLHGRVEIDEAWIGGVQAGATGRTRHGRNAALVVLALEVGDSFPGRLRTRLVPDDTADSLVGFVSDVVEVGATVITDGWTGYLALPEAGFIHERIIEGRGEGFIDSVPHLHHTVGNLKAWLAGTHKGGQPPSPHRLSRRVRLPAQPAAEPRRRLPDAPRPRDDPRRDDVRDDHRREGHPGSPLHAVAAAHGNAEATQEVRARGSDYGVEPLTTTCCGHRRQPDRHNPRMCTLTLRARETVR